MRSRPHTKFHNWKVILVGSETLLQQLATIFNSGSTRIHQKGKGFALFSDDLDGVQDPDDAENEAIRILQRCVAVANVFALQTGNATIQSMACESFLHPPHGYGFGPDFHIRVISQDSARDIKERMHELQLRLASKIVHLAGTEERVAEVLAVIGGSDPTWAAIYVALEAVAKDLKRPTSGKSAEWSPIAEKGWATDSELTALKQTANAFRHARGNPLPKKAPKLHQGQALMRRVVREWLTHKAAV